MIIGMQEHHGQSRRDIPVFIQHQASGLRQPEPLLALQKAHSDRTLESLVKLRNAHAVRFRDFFHGEAFPEIFLDPAIGLLDVTGLLDPDHALKKLFPA